jgi:hypothetical protein
LLAFTFAHPRDLSDLAFAASGGFERLLAFACELGVTLGGEDALMFVRSGDGGLVAQASLLLLFVARTSGGFF